MTTFDTMAWLESLHGHLANHPSLLGTVSNFEANEAQLRVGGVDLADGKKLRAFAGWLATLADVSPVTIVAVPGGPARYTHTHLQATGQLTDGHEAKVSVSLQAADVRPLVHDVEFTAGSTFPTNLLLDVTGMSAIADTRDGHEPEYDAVMRTDRQVDAVAESWTPDRVVALEAAMCDTGPSDDLPFNAEHTAALEQAIGRPIPDLGETGGVQ